MSTLNRVSQPVYKHQQPNKYLCAVFSALDAASTDNKNMPLKEDMLFKNTRGPSEVSILLLGEPAEEFNRRVQTFQIKLLC
jgi:hypothetical protein